MFTEAKENTEQCSTQYRSRKEVIVLNDTLVGEGTVEDDSILPIMVNHMMWNVRHGTCGHLLHWDLLNITSFNQLAYLHVVSGSFRRTTRKPLLGTTQLGLD